MRSLREPVPFTIDETAGTTRSTVTLLEVIAAAGPVLAAGSLAMLALRVRAAVAVEEHPVTFTV